MRPGGFSIFDFRFWIFKIVSGIRSLSHNRMGIGTLSLKRFRKSKIQKSHCSPTVGDRDPVPESILKIQNRNKPKEIRNLLRYLSAHLACPHSFLQQIDSFLLEVFFFSDTLNTHQSASIHHLHAQSVLVVIFIASIDPNSTWLSSI